MQLKKHRKKEKRRKARRAVLPDVNNIIQIAYVKGEKQ